MRILGFEMVETDAGQKCMIMQDTAIIQTYAKPKRPFQGWRYLEDSDAPQDRGPFDPEMEEADIPTDMEEDLRAAGLL